MPPKGKKVAGKGSSGKRKRDADDDKTGRGKRNRDILRLFDDVAAEVDDDDSDFSVSDLFDDDFLDDYDTGTKVKSEPGESQFPFMPKEEELSGDELERVLAERYRSGSGFVRHADDDYDFKKSVDRNFLIPSAQGPIIWKVKCKVGRERHAVFCLMQKFVDLKSLGKKLQIISAFTAEHIKGFVFVEAKKQSDVTEACNQIPDVYYSLVTIVPENEMSNLLTVKRKHFEVSEGMWARVKSGKYRGDLAQVVAVNNERRRVTVKLIPRIDFQALAGKYGGGGVAKKAAIPAPRLISSTELEEYRPLIQIRRDRDTGKVFEVLDGLMFKDGYLFKKVSIDSLSFWDVNPSEDELQKFTFSSNDGADNSEWLSQLYGEKKKKSNANNTMEKGGGKGEGSSGSKDQYSFEVHDLVLFGKRDFGMVIGMEKDDTYKVLKDSAEGPQVLTLGQKNLKYVPMDRKFTAIDHRMKTISINDTIKIFDGPCKGRQGIVKQIYRGTIFLHDENELENAYFCARSQYSEKVKLSDALCYGKDGDAGPSGFDDIPSSPKSPLSPKKPWQMQEKFGNRRDNDAMFSIGQTVRIRVGPLKGYLCRVIAVRYSDVTVKLDSQQKVFTVKSEHLSEVRAKSFGSSMSDDPGSNSIKSFDLLGAEGGSSDWIQGASGSAAGDGWNVGGLSSERSSWPAFPSSGNSLPGGSASGDQPADDSGKEGTGWLSTSNKSTSSSWGTSTEKAASSDQAGGWDQSFGGGASSGWGKAKEPVGDQGGSWNSGGGSSWGQAKPESDSQADPWNKGKKVVDETSNWGSAPAQKSQLDSWNKGKDTEPAGSWGKKSSVDNEDQWKSGSPSSSGWGKQKSSDKGATWGQTMDSQDEGAGNGADDAWAKSLQDKGNNEPADSWGKAADKWGNKTSSTGSKDWKGSATEPQAEEGGGWGQARQPKASGGWSKGNTDDWKGNKLENANEDAGGWGKGRDDGNGQKSSWGQSKSFGGDGGSSWNKSGGNDSWNQSKSFGNDQDNGGRGFGGRRGRGGFRGGRDPSGRGRGRSFGSGQSSGWSKESQEGSSWGGSGGGSRDQGKSWSSGVTTDGKHWNKPANDNQSSGWGRGNQGSESDKFHSNGMSSERSSAPSSWNTGSSGSSGWGQQKSWEKGRAAADENLSWGKASESQDKETSGVDNAWGKAADSWGNKNTSSAKEWKSSAGASEASGEAKGSWSKSQEGNNGGGWSKGDSAGGWSKGDSAGGGQERQWGGSKGDGGGWKSGGGGSGWSISGGNDTWEGSKNSDNDQGFGGGRGGGRRGRGGFRGGRGRFGGREGGRSFGGRGQSDWKKDGQDGSSSWGNSSTGSWGKSNDEDGSSKGWSGSQGGGSSWGNSGGGGWSKNEGNTNKSWGKSDAGGDGSSGGNKGWGGSQGGSSWGGTGGGNKNQGGGWGKDSGSNDNGGGKDAGWGKTQASWGNSCGGKTDGGGGWNKSGGEKGSSWGSSSGGGGTNDQGTGWGKGNDKGEEKGQGGGGASWGNASGGNNGQGGTADKGSSWGSASAGGGGGWGKGKAGSDGGEDKSVSGGSTWGNSSGRNNGGSGGSSWGNSSGGNNGGSGGSWA